VPSGEDELQRLADLRIGEAALLTQPEALRAGLAQIGQHDERGVLELRERGVAGLPGPAQSAPDDRQLRQPGAHLPG